jgi:hypothetical protein
MAATFNSNELLQSLQQQVREIILTTQQSLQVQPPARLLQQPAPGKWSAAECLDHLNVYNSRYIAAITAAMEMSRQKGVIPRPVFTSSWLGNYFTNLMAPKPDGSISSRMKSPANARPAAHLDAADVLARFIGYQQQWLDLLEKAQETDLHKTKVPTTLSRMLKLSLGDTFRFNIAHEQRHLLQALRAVQ